jgi:hypothetical protein
MFVSDSSPEIPSISISTKEFGGIQIEFPAWWRRLQWP